MGYFDSVTRCCCTASGPCNQPVLVSRSRCIRCMIVCEIGAKPRKREGKPCLAQAAGRVQVEAVQSE
jgi:hypothetical protein